MLRSLLSCGVLGLAIFSFGCAEMTLGPRKMVDETVLSTHHKIIPSAGVRGSFTQTGTAIRVTAARTCDLVEVKEIERTFAQERENPALVPELVLLSVGTIPAGLGAGFLIDSQNVYENDRHARLYNPSGKTGAIAGGVVLLAWGAVMMAVPLVDFARGMSSEETEEKATENGPVIRRDMPCDQGVAMAGHRSVSGRVPGDSFPLGQTDASGLFTADLVAVVPSRIFESTRPPSSMEVLIDGSVVGKASLEGVAAIQTRTRREMDAGAWSEVDVIACRSASPDHPACDEVRAYVLKFPNGEHIVEARKLLDPSTRPSGVQVAASPEDIAKAEAARKAAEAAAEAARKAAAEACRKKCEAACKKDATCTNICAEDACQ